MTSQPFLKPRSGRHCAPPHTTCPCRPEGDSAVKPPCSPIHPSIRACIHHCRHLIHLNFCRQSRGRWGGGGLRGPPTPEPLGLPERSRPLDSLSVNKQGATRGWRGLSDDKHGRRNGRAKFVRCFSSEEAERALFTAASPPSVEEPRSWWVHTFGASSPVIILSLGSGQLGAAFGAAAFGHAPPAFPCFDWLL